MATGDKITIARKDYVDTGLGTKLPLAGGSLTGALNEARATVISHATTADIWGALGNQINWTGTATTTIFPNAPQAGAERTLICAGACSFTAGVDMLIDGVPSGTVTCASGDTVIVRAITTTQFKLTRVSSGGLQQTLVSGDNIKTINGGSVLGSGDLVIGGGAMIYLSTVTASVANTVSVETGFGSTYDDYIIIASGVSLSTSGSVQMQFKIAGVYVTTTTYIEVLDGSQSSTLTGTATVASALSNINFTSIHYSCNSNIAKCAMTRGGGVDGSLYYLEEKALWNTGTGVISGIRFLRQGGGTLSGTFKLYGIKKA